MSSNPSLATAAFRLSHQQERAWSQHERGVAQFAQCSVAIEGKLDPARLQLAVTSVVSKYEILRTQLRRQSGIKLPFQTIPEGADFQFKQSAATDIGHAMQSERQQLLQSEQAAPLRAFLVGHDPARHTLILTLPVFCADSTTLERLVSEISAAYGIGEQDSDDPMQYVDLAEWQNELLASDEVKPGRTFWRTHCSTIDFASIQNASLPFEQRADGTFTPDSLRLRSSALPATSALASGVGVGVEDILLAAWHALLMRLLARHDVTVACDFDGRRYDELKAALGPLARTLPLKSQCSSDATFGTLLKDVHLLADEARNWQESFAWGQLFENEAPDLPFSFAYQDLGPSAKAEDVRFELERVYVISERFKLRLVAVQRESELTLEFHYDSSRLSRNVVERIAGWYQNLLAAAVARPATPISKLPLLSEVERRQLLVEWNQTAAAYPAGQCLHQLFEGQAANTPSREALRFGAQAYTYRELNERANQLAHYLRKHGVGPDKLVGLCLERSAETLVAVLAILKAGGAYVPLNPDNPPARLQQQLEGAVAVLTESKLAGQIPQFPGTTIVLDRDQEQWAGESAANPDSLTNPDNLVYVIYTSGSTGVPKGVAVRHRNLVNYADFISKRLELSRHPEGLQFATVSTLGADLGNTCIYPSLISGGTLHVVGYETATDSTRLAQYTAKHPIDVLKIVPSHLSALLQSQSEPEQARKLLPRKYLLFGGETLTPKLVEKIESLNPACEILNHYGPTETTVGSLTLKLKDYDWKSKQLASIPIGRPIQNTQLYVLDQNLEPVPAGVVGELYIAGAGVTAGYLNQPEKTAERFLKNPFSSDPNSKMYRTGDLVRYLEDGAVEFLGRGDDQVKVRGFRIELGEIESVLLQHTGVKQALVLARENEQGDKRLLGYVVAQSSATSNGKDLTGDDLREYLKQHVPDYMVPQAIVVLPKFPLTPNGKIDRQALPEPEQATKRAYVAPSTDAERTIAEIWAEVLRREPTSISVEDNFFDLGGHSLLATQVVSRIRRALEVELPLRTLFEHPTVASLAAQAAQIRGSATAETPQLVRADRSKPLPLSFAQQRLWVLDRIEPNNPLYNIPRAMRLKGSLNVDGLTRALNEIVRRHESQRTTFAAGADGQPVQIIAESLRLEVAAFDLTNQSEAERSESATEMAAQEAQTPFDLSKGPLLRAKLLKLATNEHILLLTMHHIVSDAWSAGIFFQELAALYTAFNQNESSPLPELQLQYADYAAWQRSYLQGKVLDEQLAYWREHLRGAPALLQLPSDRPRPEVRTFEGSWDPLPLAADVPDAVKAFCQREGVTPFMAMLAAFNALLSRYSGEQHIVLGTDIANRTTAETECMIGFFINLLPLHVDLSGDPSFRELVHRVREIALGAYAHQDIPFDKLVEDLRPERSLSHNPIVQALFVMQNTPVQRRELPGLEMTGVPVPLSRSKFDVAVFIREQGTKTIQDWLYSTELFDRSTILRMASNFETLLRDAVTNPEKRVSALQLQSAEELQRSEEEKNARKQSQRKKLMSAAPRRVDIPEKG